jgi:hypothetical protein
VTSESWGLLVLLPILRALVSTSGRGVPRLVDLEPVAVQVPRVLVVTLADEEELTRTVSVCVTTPNASDRIQILQETRPTRPLE